MAALTLTTRSPLDLEPTLFPNGIEPGSLIQLHGASGSGQTCLLTYLLARFVKCFPQKRVVLIDTRGIFSPINFAQVLSKMLPELQITQPYDHPDNLTKLMPYLDRICSIKCHTPEDLLFCFGPKNAGMLERMLLTSSDITLVAIDSLDTFSYCSSLPNVVDDSSQQMDFVKLLKRSVEGTKTPAICVMEDLSWKGSHNRENEEESNNLQFLKTESSLETNVLVDKSHFTHSIFLQRLGIVEAEEKARDGEEDKKKNNETVYRAYLRSRNNPNIALSGASHRVKFSILSGMFKWLAPD